MKVKRKNYLSLKDQQKALLELLLFVDRVAKKHNIPYWLDGGTLLGAVRHRGFIPWDDDVDICLLYKDYKKLLDVIENELNGKERYALMYKSVGEKYWNEYLCDLSIAVKTPYGIERPLRIDIIPVKVLSSDEILQDEQLTRCLNFFVNGAVDGIKSGDCSYDFRKLCSNLERAKSEKNNFFKKLDNYLLKHSDITNDKYIIRYIFNDLIVGKKREIFFAKDIFPLKYIQFEGRKFPAPSNYKVYLRKLYGNNFASLPAKKYRKAHNLYAFKVNCQYGKELMVKYVKHQSDFMCKKRSVLFWIKYVAKIVIKGAGLSFLLSKIFTKLKLLKW